MNDNQRANQEAIKKYRAELEAMIGEILQVDQKILTKSVNQGLDWIRDNTPVRTGNLKKKWKVSPTMKGPKSVSKRLFNLTEYAGPVNYGHKVVNKHGEVVGFVKGRFMLQRAIFLIDKSLEKNFEEEVRRINRQHGSRN